MVAIVRGPSLPMNIIKERKILLASPRSGVMPADRPVVAKALMVSNIICSKAKPGSNMQRIRVPMKITHIAIPKIRNALATVASGICRLKALQCLLEIRLWIFRSSTKKVVVLIPPPVEPGDAPMNMNPMITISPALLIPPMETVAKPAVLADID